jgi:hypothetical protein
MISNIASIVVAVALVVVTYLYMRHTKRMADIMVREFELKVAPIIDIRLGTRSHSSEGFEIQCLLSNLGFYPVRADKVVMKWWYKMETTRSRLIEMRLDKSLDKGNPPITVPIKLRDSEIVTPEFPESEKLSGYHLGRIIAASIWLEFYDMTGKARRTREMILDPLMS